jgi:hypothetical protein
MTDHNTCAAHMRWRTRRNEWHSNRWNGAPLTSPVADRGSWEKCFLCPDGDSVGSRLLLPGQGVPNILAGIIPAQPLDHPSCRFPNLTDNCRALADR